MAPLLDRERELDRLGARLEAASRAEGSLVIVEGLPGLGKTSLPRAAAQEAERRGFEVARARGAQLARRVAVRGRASAPGAGAATPLSRGAGGIA